MEIIWDDLQVDFDERIADKLISDWKWLVGHDKVPLMIASIGDIFLKDDNAKVYWLNVGEGSIKVVADSIDGFERKLQDQEQVSEWFMPELIAALRASGLELKSGEIYSYKKLPILGGDYTVGNFEITAMEVHFSFTGQIYEQVKDLPEGTKINEIKFESTQD